MLIFLKHVDPENGGLRGVQSIYVKLNQKVSSLVSVINDLMGWSPKDGVNLDEDANFELVLFKEAIINPFPIDGNLTFDQNHILDGDIVWFWRAQPQER